MPSALLDLRKRLASLLDHRDATQDATHDRVQENGSKNGNGTKNNGSKGTAGSKPDVDPGGNGSNADKARLPATTPWYKSRTTVPGNTFNMRETQP